MGYFRSTQTCKATQVFLSFYTVAYLELTMDEYTVSESQPSANVCVELTGDIARTVIATVFTIEGTAEGEPLFSACLLSPCAHVRKQKPCTKV